VHYRTIAEHIRAYLPPGATVLDYGCGEALAAEIVAGAARRLILCDAAPTVRAGLAARFAGRPAIEVRSPEEVAALPAGSLDVVVMHSVAQYLTPGELDERLALFRRLLRNDSLLILGDIIRPTSPRPTRWRCCGFAGVNGFFIAALFGLFAR
jgi:SAM-dependent methyltransferase